MTESLSYKILTQLPLNVSKKAELNIQIKVEEKVSVKSIEIIFPIEYAIQSMMGTRIGSANKLNALVEKPEYLQISTNIGDTGYASNSAIYPLKLTIDNTEQSNGKLKAIIKGNDGYTILEKDTIFIVRATLASVINMVGQSSIIIKQIIKTDSINDVLSTKTLSVNKFPRGFSLSNDDFKILKVEKDKTEVPTEAIYCGEPLTLRWKMFVNGGYVQIGVENIPNECDIDYFIQVTENNNQKSYKLLSREKEPLSILPAFSNVFKEKCKSWEREWIRDKKKIHFSDKELQDLKSWINDKTPNDEYDITLRLTASDKSEINVTGASVDDAGNYKKIFTPALAALEEDVVKFTLHAILLDKDKQPLLIQDIVMSEGVKVLPSTITAFNFSSAKMTVDDKVEVGNDVTLSWEKKGNVDYYILDMGGNRSKKLSGNETFFIDKPEYSTSYQLSAYVSQFPTAALDVKTVHVELCHIQDRLEQVFEAKSNLLITQVSNDGTKLYAASEKAIEVYDIVTKQDITTIAIPKGVATMVLSPDNSKLYIVDKIPELIRISTIDNTEITPRFSLVEVPKNLIFTPDGIKLCMGNKKTIDVINAENPIKKHPSFTLNTGRGFISALAVCPKEKVVLYVANTGSNTIAALIIPSDERLPLSYVSASNDLINIASDNSKTLLLPRSLTISPDGKILFISLAGNDRVIKVMTDRSQRPASLPRLINEETNAVIIRNSESLCLVTPDQKANSRLCIATGFTNSIAILDIALDSTFSKTTVELPIIGDYNPHYLISAQEGKRVYVMCSTKVFAFWTKEIIIANAPEPEKPNQTIDIVLEATIPPIDKEAAAIRDLTGQWEAEMRRTDKVLAGSDFGFFFPDLREPDYTKKQNEGLGNFGLFFPQSSIISDVSTAPVDKSEDKSTIVPDAAPPVKTEKKSILSIFNRSSSNTIEDSTNDAPLKETLSSGGWTSNPATLVQQADAITFVLNIPKRYNEKDSRHTARVNEVIKVFNQLPVLGGINDPLVINITNKSKKVKAKVVTVSPKKPDQANNLKMQLIKATGLDCTTTAPINNFVKNK